MDTNHFCTRYPVPDLASRLRDNLSEPRQILEIKFEHFSGFAARYRRYNPFNKIKSVSKLISRCFKREANSCYSPVSEKAYKVYIYILIKIIRSLSEFRAKGLMASLSEFIQVPCLGGLPALILEVKLRKLYNRLGVELLIRVRYYFHRVRPHHLPGPFGPRTDVFSPKRVCIRNYKPSHFSLI